MRHSTERYIQFAKALLVGALTGVVGAVVLVALPGAALIMVVGALGLDWDLSWFPSVATLMALGALCGAGFAGILYIKDQYVPYVEKVPDFERDDDDLTGSGTGY
ncbi:hypothetical protein [Sneathiella chinensis]|uniref:Uncharacterized protein n=1 Tax=Sneathiella chinensis TaxID=349750 RepID=A0ABQ5U9U7_9PROT|nr:hypothetical protein [Sneathiella chinensis]GLQ07945.1 hypothetical protein GCM10007924_31670 [Sneathiella chinensis]